MEMRGNAVEMPGLLSVSNFRLPQFLVIPWKTIIFPIET